MKLSTAILLLAPACLSAQNPPAGPPANPITTTFRAAIANRHMLLARAFDSIPADKFSFKPTPAQQTIGYVAQHLATDDYLFCNAFGEKKATRPAEDTETSDSVKATWPKDKLVAKLKDAIAFCTDAMTQLDDAKLADMVPVTFRGQTRQTVRAQMVLLHAMDLTDHYSQIANYMRLNGLLPPSALPTPPPRP